MSTNHSDVEELQKRIDELESEVTRLQSDNARLQTENAGLKDQLKNVANRDPGIFIPYPKVSPKNIYFPSKKVQKGETFQFIIDGFTPTLATWRLQSEVMKRVRNNILSSLIEPIKDNSLLGIVEEALKSRLKKTVQALYCSGPIEDALIINLFRMMARNLKEIAAFEILFHRFIYLDYLSLEYIEKVKANKMGLENVKQACVDDPTEYDLTLI